ncbi:ABC transporter permease [Streptomyces sp. 11-1-2]|uniref:ABC transporter permease n=1 Tax=unclassified Streptomyces TaxID=2593676 RepID=UPI000B8D6245|nr:ABC transporter permease [Streptomyces sp. 11-1-2]ASQ93240.1 hypothetical protein CGL27_08930 [Streptomyces sp. 11-1-2]
MSRTTVHLAGVLPAACSAMVLSACSSESGEAPKVAGGGGPVKPMDDGAIRRAWVQCTHDAGQTEVQLDKDGQIQMPMGQTEEGGGSGAGTDDPRKRAMDTCDEKVPGREQLQERGVPPELVEQARSLAQCLVVGVMERQGEVGLRRALGTRQGQIAAQFLVEAVPLGLLGGLAGAALGSRTVYGHATAQDWPPVIPATWAAAGPAMAVIVGTTAGLYLALRAGRMPPTTALRAA